MALTPQMSVLQNEMALQNPWITFFIDHVQNFTQQQTTTSEPKDFKMHNLYPTVAATTHPK